MFAIACAALIAVSPTDAWPAFRGDGTSIAGATLPLHWSPKEGIAWTADLSGYGQSSPVVWKDRVYVTAVEGAEKDRYLVACFRLRDGVRLWSKEIPADQKWKSGPLVSRAAPTPAADANGVVAFLEGGSVVALSPDGDLRWQRSLVKDYGEFQNKFGLAGSLAAAADAVFVLIDHEGPSYLLALDKKTGKNLWKADRASRSSWTSPAVGKIHGRRVVVVSSVGTVDGYDAETGALLFRHEGLTGNSIPSAVIHDDGIIVGASEGKMGKDAVAAGKSNLRLDVVPKGEGFETRVAWVAKKAMASMPSPVVHDGVTYFVNRSGVVFGLDAATGEEKFAERLDGAIWATPIAAGKHVYFFGKDGVTTIVKAGSTFERAATNTLWADDAKRKEPEGGAPFSAMDPLVYGVAAVEGRLLFRTKTKLYCVNGFESRK